MCVGKPNGRVGSRVQGARTWTSNLEPDALHPSTSSWAHLSYIPSFPCIKLGSCDCVLANGTWAERQSIPTFRSGRASSLVFSTLLVIDQQNARIQRGIPKTLTDSALTKWQELESLNSQESHGPEHL